MNKWIVALFGLALLTVSAGADEARGIVKEKKWGTFTLEEGDLVRQFNQSAKSSQYEPQTWRPTPGDKVQVEFTTRESKGKVTLAVDKVTLLKAGPDTLVEMKSPVQVVVVESGRSGIRAKVPAGQVVKFSSGKNTVWDPAGWVPSPGEKATVEFQVKNAFVGFDVVYEALSIKRAP